AAGGSPQPLLALLAELLPVQLVEGDLLRRRRRTFVHHQRPDRRPPPVVLGVQPGHHVRVGRRHVRLLAGVRRHVEKLPLLRAVPPLSFMNTTSVSFSIPHSASLARSLPTLSSMLAIMPKNFACRRSFTLPAYRASSSGLASSGACGAFVAM